MKKQSKIRPFLFWFAFQTAFLTAAILYMKTEGLIFSAKSPFVLSNMVFSNQGVNDLLRQEINNFVLIKYNIVGTSILMIFLNLSVIAAAHVFKKANSKTVQRILLYMGSSLICSALLFPIVKNWVLLPMVYLCGLAVGYWPMFFALKGYFKKDDGKDEQFIRGAEKAKEKNIEEILMALSRKESKKGEKQGIKIWKDVRLPFNREPQNLLITGSTGAGKTQTIYPLIKQLIQRGDKVVLLDIKGDYTQALADNDKVDLLAAWDKRSLKWCVGKDVKTVADCQNTSYILIPENIKDSQPHFLDSARLVMESSLLLHIAKEKMWGWRELWDFLSQPRKTLVKELKHTDDGKKISDVLSGSNRSSKDVHTTLKTACRSIRWLANAWSGEGISLREWVKNSEGRVLILGGIPLRKELAKTTANLALQVLSSEILSLPDSRERRIWFILDELGSLGKNESLLELFTTGRSKGVCSIVGIQDIGKIEHYYGRERAKSIVNAFNTSIFLRSTDPSTSQWVSNILGEQEIKEHHSSTQSTSKTGDKKNLQESKTESIHRKPLYLASEIANFPDLTGVLNVAGWPNAKLKWPLIKIPNHNPVCVDEDWVNEKPEYIDYIIDDNFDPGEETMETSNQPSRADWDL